MKTVVGSKSSGRALAPEGPGPKSRVGALAPEGPGPKRKRGECPVPQGTLFLRVLDKSEVVTLLFCFGKRLESY